MKNTRSHQAPAEVVMIGTFPPPTHGMAAVNAAVRDLLCASGTTVTVKDTSAKSLQRSFGSRFVRLPKVMAASLWLLARPRLRNVAFYIGVSGGFGQIYDQIVVSIARLRRMRIFLHHHSYAYLLDAKRTTRALMYIAGRDATHITQCQSMSAALKELYAATKVYSVSNCVFLAGTEKLPPRVRSELRIAGFISNISEEKGVYDFLHLMREAEEAGLNIQGRIAGPFEDKKTEEEVLGQVELLSHVQYVGPRYGKDKDEFFDTIDALIFPTHYLNETEGLVNLEAMSRGVPVIAYARGCIPEIIRQNSGFLVDPRVRFSPLALEQIKDWRSHPSRFANVSSAAASAVAEIRAESKGELDEVIKKIILTGKPLSDAVHGS